MDFLRTLAPRVYVVRGDMDDDPSLPAHVTVTIGGVRIGLAQGHAVIPRGDAAALATLQRKLDVDVLVTGGTHVHSVVEYERRCYVNPGSVTGAYTPLAAPGTVRPSFTLMSIQEGGRLEFFLYELVDGKLNISRSTFNKNSGRTEAPARQQVPSAPAPAPAPAPTRPAAAPAAAPQPNAQPSDVVGDESL